MKCYLLTMITLLNFLFADKKKFNNLKIQNFLYAFNLFGIAKTPAVSII